MAFEYIRGIMRPDGKVLVEYQAIDAEEPGQVISEENLADKSDREIIEFMQDKSPLFDDPDYVNITINREWYESQNSKGS